MVRHEKEKPVEANSADGTEQTTRDGNTGHADTEASIESLQAELSEERARADGYLAQWKRTTADFQNYKRRTEQEREEYGRLANTALVLNFLPAIDDLDRAISSLDPEAAGQNWVEGIQAIQRKLRGALEASGVTEIRAEGEPFDPTIHEAISQAPGDHGKVIAEVQRGYRLGNRVIRPALVVVGSDQAGA